MGWTEHQYWQSTPTGFYLAAEAFGERLDSDLRRLAWHAANIMNMLRGRKSRAIKVSDLVKEPREPAPEFANREQFLEYMRVKKRRRALREFDEKNQRATVH